MGGCNSILLFLWPFHQCLCVYNKADNTLPVYRIDIQPISTSSQEQLVEEKSTRTIKYLILVHVCEDTHKNNKLLILFPNCKEMVRFATANNGKYKNLQLTRKCKMKQQFSCLFHFIQ